MYSNISLTVQSGDGLSLSPFFMSLLGVRHNRGDNLSPTLFHLFINDIPKIFNDGCDPILFGNMHLSSLMYAVDLLILSESSQGLQQAMTNLLTYTITWGLTVNIDTTNFMVTKSRIHSVNKLMFNGKAIEQVQKRSEAYFKLMRSINPSPNPCTSLHLFYLNIL